MRKCPIAVNAPIKRLNTSWGNMKPNCYKCVHRLSVSGDAHSRCNNHDAKVTCVQHGYDSGWFNWPVNFDPAWLLTCDGFSDDKKDKMARKELDSLSELLGILK